MSTDRLDMAQIQNSLKGAIALTPSLVIYSCLDDNKFQGNLKYLEDNHCSVGKLKITLQTQIQEEEEEALMVGASSLSPLCSPDMENIMDFIGRYMAESGVQGMTPTFEEVLNHISEENSKNRNKFSDVVFALRSSGYNASVVKRNNKYKFLNKYCEDLVTKASNNKLDPLIGREPEVERMVEILAHYKKKNPLLVGDAGVGKTAVVEGLASAIAQGKVPGPLKEARIFSTSIAKLMAGAKFRGDVEEKVGALIKDLKKHEEETQKPTYLFIDEVHQIIGAGSSGNNDGSNIANIIKPELASGDLALIGATTSKEYKRTIQKDDALNRRFQLVRVEEPSDEETIQILRKGIAPVLTSYHGVSYSKPVIEKIVKLTSKYITDKAQPDKSISLMDSIGARLRTTESRVASKVSDVEKLVSRITGTPISAFKAAVKAKNYVDIEKELNKVVFGQEKAMAKIAKVYNRSKANLSKKEQPIGSILAVGPTGTGKTECAKALANITKSHFFKLDMGEYTEKHSVAKLFGTQPGYKGYGEGGLLTNEIRKYPHTILLIDEIEKANETVREALLGVIDGGSMTDGEGNKVDFSNVMLIMSSNAGARQAESKKGGINLVKGSENLEEIKAKITQSEISKAFAPEFLNKLTSVVTFKSLNTEVIKLVTNKFLKQAADLLKERHSINVEFTPSVYEYVREKGFSSKFGARPISKLVDEVVIENLVEPILKGEISKGDELMFDVKGGEVTYKSKVEEEEMPVSEKMQ